MTECPYCGSDDVEYFGFDDGGGDYGNSVRDQWECNACGNSFEDGCIEIDDDDVALDDDIELTGDPQIYFTPDDLDDDGIPW